MRPALVVACLMLASACSFGVARPTPADVAAKVPTPLPDEAPEVFARRFFAAHVALSDAFDPAAVAFFDDEATITADRVYPDGRTRTLSFTGAEFKETSWATWNL